MKKVIVFAIALVAASTLLARGHAPYRPPHVSVHTSHHHHHGSGGAIAAGIVGGALLGGLVASAVSTPAPVVVTPAPTVVAPAPVVVQQPVVVSQPVVVAQPVYQTQNVWVEGRYVDTVQPNGTVLRTWQPGHYEQRTVQIQ
jgi:hypothetical protein